MRIIDLSHDIYEKMPGFPGYPIVMVHEFGSVTGPLGAAVGKYRWNAYTFLMTDHHGTHVDAPFHLNPEGKAIHEMPVDRFISEAVILNVTHIEASCLITVDDLEKALKRSKEAIKPGDAVLLYTGWGQKWETEEYSKHPGLSEEASRWLLNKKVSMIGIDALSTDIESPGYKPKSHEILLAENSIPIAENLCNLDKINKSRVTFIALPLKIRGATGSPVRAVAIEK